MSVLIVMDSLTRNNGAHVATRAMVAALRERGVTVDLLLGKRTEDVAGIEGVAQYELGEPRRGLRWLVSGVYRRLKIAPVPRWVLDPWGKVRRRMRQYDTVLVVGENSHFRWLVAGVKGPRKVVFIHTDYVNWKTSCSWAIEDSRFDRQIYQGFDVIAVVGQPNADRFAAYYPEFASKARAFHNLFYFDKSALPLQLQTPTKNSPSAVHLHLPPTPPSPAPVCDRRAMAEKKVGEWLEGVDDETFAAALEKLVGEKAAAGEYRFKWPEERRLAISGARQFYCEFSRKIVPLSDGRFVYFAPDARSKEWNASNAISWAEYAFHAVSNGGVKLTGRDYHERWYNPHKGPAFASIERTLKGERCFVRLAGSAVSQDAIVFASDGSSGRGLRVVTRLDEMGNMDANLSEVTFTASSKREKKLPRLVPLAEAVQTVVHHQITAGSYSPDDDMVANSAVMRKGGVSSSCSAKNSPSALHLHLPPTLTLPHLQPSTHNPQPLKIVTISRLDPGPPKMMDRLVRVAGELKRRGCVFDWKIYGKGSASDETRLKALAQKEDVGDMLHFAGYTNKPLEVLAQADLHVLLSSYEGAPNAIVEAQMLGVPCIATDVGAVREMIDEGKSGMVLPQDESVISDRIEGVLKNPAVAAGWKRNLVGYRYDNEKVMAEYKELLEMSCGG